MPKAEIQVIRVEPDKVQALTDLSIKTFVDAFGHLNTAKDMNLYLNGTFNQESLLAELTHPHNHFYFAIVDGAIAGYTKISYPDYPSADKLFEIERLYVLSDYQGQSIGEQLIEFAVEKARNHQFAFIILGVWEHNLNAIRFYERHGFVHYSEHDFMLGTDRQTDWLMKKTL